ncbi:hypothetical protein ACFP51_10555 [Streptomyces pratens]|uniref:Bacterial Ig-like domain-containing protein n=1 Tax=Streptomyces pratens TaxID=887456 RepID=A0ABW1LW76_9ACTN
MGNHGVRLAAVDETDPLTWRRYHSANQTDGTHNAAYEPSLTVTYNTEPGTATAVPPASGTYTSDTTPTLSAKATATDADGRQLTLRFEVRATDGTAALRSGTSASVASGAVATHTVAALSPGTYKWRARASDGTDTRKLTHRVDGGAPQTVTTTGGPVELRLAPAAEGSHQLTVTATDRAGDVSSETKRTFYAGRAVVTAPANGEILVGSVDLAVSGPGDLKDVTFIQRASAAPYGDSAVVVASVGLCLGDDAGDELLRLLAPGPDQQA